MVAEVRVRPGRVVISTEDFASARPKQVAQARRTTSAPTASTS